jgi:hypothetical protein
MDVPKVHAASGLFFITFIRKVIKNKSKKSCLPAYGGLILLAQLNFVEPFNRGQKKEYKSD